MRTFSSFIVGIAAVMLLSGCGGSHGSGDGGDSGRGAGQISLTVKWPPPSRLIPAASNSIKAVLTRGAATLGTQTLVRPAEAPWTTTATFNNLAAGPVTLTASAFPSNDATGIAQASGSAPASIVAGQTVNVVVTLGSTIASLGITPANPTVRVGGTAQLTATAKDAQGNVVLVQSGSLQWTSSAPANATVNGTGLVTGVAAGTSNVTVKDSESGITSLPAAVQVFVNPLNDPRFMTMAPDGQTLYVVSTGTKSITQFHINTDGSLVPLTPANVSGPPGPLVFYAQATPQTSLPFVYVTNPDSDAISQFRYDSGGRLTALSPPTVFTNSGDQPAGLAIHPNGRFLYAADPVHSSQIINPRISQFRINSDGTLSQLAPDLEVNGHVINRLAVTPNGKFLYSNNSLGTNGHQGLFAYRINTDGTLALIGDFGGTNLNMFELTVDPTSRFLYTASTNVGGTKVAAFRIGTDGSLTALGAPQPSGTTAPNAIITTPDGRFVYSAMAQEDRLFGYRVKSDGSLEPLAPASFATDSVPIDIEITPNGQFLYVSNSRSSSISSFRINSTGALTPLP